MSFKKYEWSFGVISNLETPKIVQCNFLRLQNIIIIIITVLSLGALHYYLIPVFAFAQIERMESPPYSPSRSKNAPKNTHNWFPTKETVENGETRRTDVPPTTIPLPLPQPKLLSLRHPAPPVLSLLLPTSKSMSPTDPHYNERRPSNSSKSTNPPSDDDESDEDEEWGFHCNADDIKKKLQKNKTAAAATGGEEEEEEEEEGLEVTSQRKRTPVGDSEEEPPRRRYSADDVDYLRHAMFVLECEETGIGSDYNTSPTTTLLASVYDNTNHNIPDNNTNKVKVDPSEQNYLNSNTTLSSPPTIVKMVAEEPVMIEKDTFLVSLPSRRGNQYLKDSAKKPGRSQSTNGESPEDTKNVCKQNMQKFERAKQTLLESEGLLFELEL